MSWMGRSWLIGSLAGSVLAGGLSLYAQSSQFPAISSQHRHTRGQSVVPLYRGWYRGKGTQVYLAFEYLNRNSEETLEIPIGPNNAIAPVWPIKVSRHIFYLATNMESSSYRYQPGWPRR